MNWQQKVYTYPLPLRYVLSRGQSEGLAVVLHGYQDNANSLLKRLGWLDADLPFQWLALNAPFPVPVWSGDGFKEAYSWYFRDTDRNLVFVKPSTTAERIAQFLGDLGFKNRPLAFFGFSQGGYMAPYIAKLMNDVRGIVGLGCGYTEEGYADLKPLPIWGLHGAQDERIPLEKAKSEHADIMRRGFTGSFIEIPNLTHKVEQSVAPLVSDLIHRSFKGSP